MLSPKERLASAVLLFLAGNEPTTNLTGDAVLCVFDHSEQLARAQTRSLVPTLIEEVLRYESPVQEIFRRVAHCVEPEGGKIPAGLSVCLRLRSADRDEPKLF